MGKLTRALGVGIRVIAEVSNAAAAARASSSRAPELSDDEKKAGIIHAHRAVWEQYCAKAGTQVPLILFAQGTDSSGISSLIWESEDAILRTAAFLPWAADCGGNIERQRQVLTRGIEGSWHKSGVATQCSIEPGYPARLIVRFGTYREMIDRMYANVPAPSGDVPEPEAPREIHRAPSQSQDHEVQIAMMQQELERREMESIMQRNQAVIQLGQDTTRMMGQALGNIPLYYKDGIPHYS